MCFIFRKQLFYLRPGIFLKSRLELPQNARNGISDTKEFKISRGSMLPDPLKISRAFGTRNHAPVSKILDPPLQNGRYMLKSLLL